MIGLLSKQYEHHKPNQQIGEASYTEGQTRTDHLVPDWLLKI